MKTRSVLLVDDDTDDQEFFVEALKEISSFNLYGIASKGKEAIALLEGANKLPDFIFTDIQMPVMDGIQYLKALKANPRTQKIPVIILSSATEQSVAACRLGATSFIKKPDTRELLIYQLTKHLNVVTHHQTYSVIQSNRSAEVACAI